MTLLERILPIYKIAVKCENCGLKCKINVRKGITVEEFARSEKAKCPHCACRIKIKEYTTEWIK